MNTNLYREFHDHHSFAGVKRLVESLDDRLPTDAPEAYAEHEGSVASILDDLSWDDLDRTGERTMRETTYASHEYERPGFRLYVQTAFDSDELELQETVLRATVGHEIGRSLPREDTVRETVRYVVRADGHVERS